MEAVVIACPRRRAPVTEVFLDLSSLVACVTEDLDGAPTVELRDGSGAVVVRLVCGDDGPDLLAALGADRLVTVADEAAKLAVEIRAKVAARAG